jgi:ABC-type sugar transport system permease subunit
MFMIMACCIAAFPAWLYTTAFNMALHNCFQYGSTQLLSIWLYTTAFISEEADGDAAAAAAAAVCHYSSGSCLRLCA